MVCSMANTSRHRITLPHQNVAAPAVAGSDWGGVGPFMETSNREKINERCDVGLVTPVVGRPGSPEAVVAYELNDLKLAFE